MITIKDVQEKIARVDKDIAQLRTDGGAERALAALGDYKDYLKDELRMLEDANRSGTRSNI